MGEPADILVTICNRRRERLGSSMTGLPVEVDSSSTLGPDHPFLDALTRPDPSIIAEIKLGSPRLGDLRSRIDVERQVAAYAQGGAVAVSVVVEDEHFFGSYELLERCVRISSLPVLAKDFVVDSVQIEWAAAAGASAVLLIASVLDPRALSGLARRARELGLVPLVELHDADDVARLAGDGWEIVGVNNRDLRTFEVDLEHSLTLAASLPDGACKVAESGLSSPEDVARLAAAGFTGFLIGESLLLADDPADLLRRLRGVDGV